MKMNALQLLACPKCRETLSLTDTTIEGEEVISGNLICKATSCGESFRIQRGIPRFFVTESQQEGTADDYGFQWSQLLEGHLEQSTVYGVSQDEWKEYFEKSTGVPLSNLRGLRVLDAGCGSGKVVRALAPSGCEVLSLDIHSGLDDVYLAGGRSSGCNVVQGDALAPPLKPGSFDIVWSSGMIHRTPDPKRAFKSICQLVAPGGRLFVWVCRTRRNPYRIVRSLTIASHKIPTRLLFLLCRLIAIPLFIIFNSWYLLGRLRQGQGGLGFRQARNRYRSFGEITLTLFDILAPQYLWHFDETEVRSWFVDAGFEQISSTDTVDIGICGVRKGGT